MKRKVHKAARRVRTKKPAPVRKKKPAARAAAPGAGALPHPRQRIIAAMAMARTMTDDLLKGIPADKHFAQPAGPHDNHAVWTLGHLATFYQWSASLIDGKEGGLPSSYQGLFGWKSKPQPDAAIYPSYEEIRRHFEDAYDRFLKLALALSDAEMLKPPAMDTGGYAKDKLEVIEKAVWHEGWHAGQLAALRRALGIPPLM